MILMSHPEHGFTHVYDEQELKERLGKGWTVVEEKKEEPKPKRKYTRKAQA